MKLADQIETMRKRMVEENQFALNQIEHLEKRMITADAEVLRRLGDVKELQSQNATAIARELLTIANRIGFLPNPQYGQQPGAVQGNQIPPPNDDAFDEIQRIVSEAGAVH